MATSQFPIFDFDAFMKQFSMPNLDPKAMMEAQQKNVEALVAANQKVAENMQKIAQREQQIIQEAISGWGAVAADIDSDGDMEEQSVRRTEAAIKAVEDGIRNMRSFAEMVSRAQADSMEILNNRMDEGIRELRQQVTKTSPSSTKSKK